MWRIHGGSLPTAAFVHGPLPYALRGPLSTRVHATHRKGALTFFTSFFSLRHFERLETKHDALHTSVFSQGRLQNGGVYNCGCFVFMFRMFIVCVCFFCASLAFPCFSLLLGFSCFSGFSVLVLLFLASHCFHCFSAFLAFPCFSLLLFESFYISLPLLHFLFSFLLGGFSSCFSGFLFFLLLVFCSVVSLFDL